MVILLFWFVVALIAEVHVGFGFALMELGVIRLGFMVTVFMVAGVVALVGAGIPMAVVLLLLAVVVVG